MSGRFQHVVFSINSISRKLLTMNSTRRSILLAGAGAGCAALSGAALASGGPRIETATTDDGMKINFTALRSDAASFVTGDATSQNVAYIFFDPQCPHCAALWMAHRPLQAKAKFVWIPVGVLNRASTAQGATILGAADPKVAMDEHEKLLTTHRGGITANSDALKKFEKAIEANTKLLRSTGGRSVPLTITKNRVTGKATATPGALPTHVLAATIGIQP